VASNQDEADNNDVDEDIDVSPADTNVEPVFEAILLGEIVGVVVVGVVVVGVVVVGEIVGFVVLGEIVGAVVVRVVVVGAVVVGDVVVGDVVVGDVVVGDVVPGDVVGLVMDGDVDGDLLRGAQSGTRSFTKKSRPPLAKSFPSGLHAIHSTSPSC